MIEFLATILSLAFTGFLGYCVFGLFKKEKKRRHFKIGGIGALVTFLGFAVISPLLPTVENKEKTTNSDYITETTTNMQQQEKEKQHFRSDLGVKTDLFDKRFNAFANTLDKNFYIQSHKLKYTQGGIYDTETASEFLSNELGFSINRRVNNKKIVNITLIYVPEGSKDSAIEMMLAAAGMISGIQPHFSPRERGEIAAIMIDAVETQETKTINKEGIIYTANFSPEIGFLLSADSEE